MQDLGCGLLTEKENSHQTKDDSPSRRHVPLRGRNAPAEASGGTFHKDLEENRVYTHIPKYHHAEGYQMGTPKKKKRKT